MTAKPIAVAGTKPLGLSMNLLRSSKVHSPPLAFMAAEKLNPRPSPLWSPTMPKRLGPTRFGPPFSKVWQAPHFFAAAAPLSTEAVCSSFSIGSDGAAAASLAPVASPSAFATMAKPGFSGSLGVKSAPAVKLVTSRMRQVPRMAPRILLSSKESIFGSGSRPEMSTIGRRETAADASGIRLSHRTPSHDEISVCPCSGNPYKRNSFRPIPIISGSLATGSRPHSDDQNPRLGADSRPHGGHPAAGQTAAGYRRPADDRPCAAAGRGRPNRPRRGRHRHGGDRGRGHRPWRGSRHDASRPPFRLGPDLRGAVQARPPRRGGHRRQPAGRFSDHPHRQHP